VSDQKKFRITLWAIDQTAGTSGGWRGEQKAVVFDASAIGVEEHANDVGSAFWTLDNKHPQIAEFIPLARHYEIARWSDARSRWEFVGAGILNDYSVTEWETTFQGIDYKAVLNQLYTPLSGMTTENASPLTTIIGSNGITNAASVPFKIEETAAGTIPRYFNTSAFDFEDSPVIYTYPGTLREVSASEATALLVEDNVGIYVNHLSSDDSSDYRYYETPKISIQWSAIWYGGTATSGFDQTGYFRIYASPPAPRDSGSPGLSDIGLIGEFSDVFNFQGASGNIIEQGVGWGPYVYYLYPQELKALVEETEGVGSFDGKDYIEKDSFNLDWSGNERDVACLRTGVSYSFQIYAAVERTATGLKIWYRSNAGAVMGSSETSSPQFGQPFQIALGQGSENANTKITRIFNNSVTSIDSDYSRLRYSSMAVINSGSTATTHTTITAGEPVLNHIASICDLEMGAKTDGSKVVFGINKPTGGATYDGTFQLNLSVSSSASTAMSLRYPENIRSFSFTPGYSRVRNDIKVIPSTGYLAGSSGQNSMGTSLIGATAVDQSSISVNGRITLLAAKDNLLNAAAAQNEANRLLNTYKVANSKQVGIRAVLDGIDLWNGWDVGDSIRVTINQGLAIVDEPFVISGVRWFGEADGHERIELDLVQGSAFAAAYTAPPTTSAT
jgi:hypothetical protein